MTEVVEAQTKLSVLFSADDVTKLSDESRLAVRSKSHHLAFISIMWKAQKLRRRCVDDPRRVRVLDVAQHFNRIPFSLRPHRRDEVTETVDRQQCRTLEWRDIKATGEMRAMMLDVVKARVQVLFRDAKR